MMAESFQQLEQNSHAEMKNNSQLNKTCSICLNNLPNHAFSSMGCSHNFCKECLTSHIYQQLQRFQVIACPEEGCEHVIDHSSVSVYHGLQNRDKRRIDTILSNFSRMVTIKKCKKCQEGQLIESLLDQQAIYFCNKCNQKHCYNCCKPVHPGRRQCVSEEQIELPSNCQQCRKCFSIVEKVQGCSHIKCWCGFEFCFECGYHWDTNHICEYKLIRRQGLSQICCCLAKFALFILLLLPIIVLFLILATFAVCFFSAMMGGIYLWSYLFQCYFKPSKTSRVSDSQMKKQSNEDSKCCQLFVLVFGLLGLPLLIVVVGAFSFFLPFLNICYKRKLLLNPDILKDIVEQVQRWIDLLLVI